jgi:protein subunit release factor A
VTDHRIGLTLHQLDRIIEGKMDDIIDALIAHYQSEKLKQPPPRERGQDEAPSALTDWT